MGLPVQMSSSFRSDQVPGSVLTLIQVMGCFFFVLSALRSSPKLSVDVCAKAICLVITIHEAMKNRQVKGGIASWMLIERRLVKFVTSVSAYHWYFSFACPKEKYRKRKRHHGCCAATTLRSSPPRVP